MIFNVQPVTNVFSVTVNRQLLPLHCVKDHEWNQFLRKLVRTIVVGTVGNQGGQLEGVMVSPYEMVRSSLGS